MVESINTIGTALSGTGVVREALVPEKKQEVAKASVKLDIRSDDKTLDLSSDDKLQLALKDDVDTQDFIKSAEKYINKFLPEQAPNTKLRIDQDDYGNFIYQGVDVDSGEIVTQFPAEEVLDFIAFYREKEGIVVDEQA